MEKKKILTLVLSEKKILSEKKNHRPLQVKWSVPYLHWLNTQNTTTYEVEIPGPGLRQAHKCGSVKLVNWILTLSFW
jgi:hypothetical protein